MNARYFFRQTTAFVVLLFIMTPVRLFQLGLKKCSDKIEEKLFKCAKNLVEWADDE